MFNIKNLKIKENYINFNEYQLTILDSHEFNGSKTKKIQSVLRYVMKYSPNNKLVYSIHKLYKMYSSKGKRMSQRYFYNLIAELKDLNLLEEKENEIFLVLSKKVQEKVQEKVQTENSTESVENANVSEFHVPTLDTANSNINNNNIYNITSSKFCPAKNDVIATKEQLKAIAEDLYKNLKIRSSHIKGAVLDVICAFDGKIYLKSARAYLSAVICDKKIKRDKEREEFARKYVYLKNISRAVNNQGSNYTSNNSKRFTRQFTEEEIRKANELENALLGW